ncbi:small oligopeptide transporter, OPT family [Aspergillus novofumigatus IBT 16806]|uniref:Small oligopeptide transporter, OPT family n=1 Tax=Aspergillus novofumigatus (strain IBT 16806) TaxID=1392255 RepID=A0A2I1C3N0_ASPN1|nr:small oligopeptide transporter, OPT family [Aspergillus novofumigatus IBT 16806]PKX92239.1 small oligopeptide transporter, OPT family [Aspergillus novofumigatus IBT 16806]
MESKKESVDISVCQSLRESTNERAEAPEPQIYTQETQLEIGDDIDDDVVSPEVRASVAADDEDIPVNTFRAWFLGIVGTVILTALNQFFQLHSPPLFLSAYLAILVTFPCGRLMEAVLPERKWKILGWTFTLNPGRFNQKEHCIVAIMASLVTAFDNGSLATDVYVAFEKFLHIPVSLGYRFMFLLTTQALSFGIAGLFHKFLVEPAACVWPGVLPTCSMLYTMHQRNKQNEEANGWKISRMKLFAVVILCGAAYQFLPGFLFTGLTTFAWISWIVPNNVTVNQVFGAVSGMDLLPMTLDWNQITGYLGSPLLVPTWALTNVFCGSIFFLWIVSPALHWSNVWQGMYMPFSSSKTFDNTGKPYNTSRVMNPDYSLNQTAYHEYSPVFLSTTSVLSYGLGFAAVASIIVHTALYHRREIWYGLLASIGRSSVEEKPDIHARLMKRYKQVPLWWYACTFLAIFSISIAFLYAYDTGLPWYGLILAIALHIILLLPTGIMMAYCNIKLSTAVISALVAGYIWPGKMMNNVVFKIFTLVSSAQGLGYISVMKLAHYMKIPPRVTFAAQCTGIIVSWLTQTAVNVWAMGNVEDVCTPEASNNARQFLCPLAAGYATNATFWGLIGPKRLFSEGSMYRSMLWFFFIGAASPIVLYLLDRRFPRAMLRKVHLPAIFASTASIPPATAANYMAWGIVGLYFNGHLKRGYRRWWMKYNYILSAGLDAALAVGNFLIFFCLAYPGVQLKWFGNEITSRTADGIGVPLRTVERGQTFGPRTWN